MVTENDIRKQLRDFLGESEETILAEVTAVDEANYSCTLDNDGSEIFEVRLQPILTDVAGVVIIPKLNTQVLAVRIEATDEYMVVKVSEVEKIIITVGDRKLSITSDAFLFNEGKKGLVKLDAMVKWMQKVYSDLQTLKGTLSLHPVPATGSPLALVFSPTVESPTESMFEDTTIKH